MRLNIWSYIWSLCFIAGFVLVGYNIIPEGLLITFISYVFLSINIYNLCKEKEKQRKEARKMARLKKQEKEQIRIEARKKELEAYKANIDSGTVKVKFITEHICNFKSIIIHKAVFMVQYGNGNTDIKQVLLDSPRYKELMLLITEEYFRQEENEK